MGTLLEVTTRPPHRGFLLLVLLTLTCGCATARPAAIHLLSVSIDPERKTLSASDEITLPPGRPADLSISLSPAASIRTVMAGGTTLPYRFEGGVLRVEAPSSGISGPLTVAYEAAFHDPVPDRPVNAEDPTYGIVGTITTDGTFLSGEAGWHPAVASVPNSYRIRVSAPEGTEALTNGKRLARGTHGGRSSSEWEIGPTDDRLTLVAGRFIVRELSALGGDTPVYSYFSEENDELAEKYLAASAKFLAFYRELFGPYPFPKFAVADNFFPSGYGFPSWTLLGRNVVRLPFILDTSLGHEIAHSWWGNGVRVKPGDGNWSEGITSYVADYLADERTSFEKGREHRLKLLRDYATLVPGEKDFPLRRFTTRTDASSRAVGYGKGAMVFHMARVRAGDAHFWQALRRVAREKMFREAAWGDFADALERESGKPFGSFFRQWVERPGAPVLALAGATSTRAGNGWVVSGRVTQSEPAFDLTVPLRIETENGETVDGQIELRGVSAPFSFRSAASPRRLLLDPDISVFRHLAPEEIPPAVNHINGSPSLRVVLSRGASPWLRRTGQILMESLGQGSAQVLEEASATPEALSGHDLLYLGLPGRDGFLPRLPPSLSVSPGRFSLNDVAYDAPGDALFAVFQSPIDPARKCALFLPLSDDAAEKAARKIVHYGKYGYLVFSEGTNRVKGSWPPRPSAAVVEFIGGRDSGQSLH